MHIHINCARVYHHTQGTLRGTPDAAFALHTMREEQRRDGIARLLTGLGRVWLCFNGARARATVHNPKAHLRKTQKAQRAGRA